MSEAGQNKQLMVLDAHYQQVETISIDVGPRHFYLQGGLPEVSGCLPPGLRPGDRSVAYIMFYPVLSMWPPLAGQQLGAGALLAVLYFVYRADIIMLFRWCTVLCLVRYLALFCTCIHLCCNLSNSSVALN